MSKTLLERLAELQAKRDKVDETLKEIVHAPEKGILEVREVLGDNERNSATTQEFGEFVGTGEEIPEVPEKEPEVGLGDVDVPLDVEQPSEVGGLGEWSELEQNNERGNTQIIDGIETRLADDADETNDTGEYGEDDNRDSDEGYWPGHREDESKFRPAEEGAEAEELEGTEQGYSEEEQGSDRDIDEDAPESGAELNVGELEKSPGGTGAGAGEDGEATPGGLGEETEGDGDNPGNNDAPADTGDDRSNNQTEQPPPSENDDRPNPQTEFRGTRFYHNYPVE